MNKDKIFHFVNSVWEKLVTNFEDIANSAPDWSRSIFPNIRKTVKPIAKRVRHLSLPMIIAIGASGLFIFIIFSAITYSYFVADLATPEKLMNRNNSGLILMDREGKAFYKTAQAREIKIYPIEDVPDSMKKALIAIEDNEFYTHPGFSIRSIGRAIFANFRSSSAYSQGASTITQQLIKNALLTPEKSYRRKLQEILLAVEVDRRYSKDEILEMYLNSIYFGSGAYGIEEASQTYFDKEPSELTIPESAILASLPKAPSALTPFGGDSDALFARQQIVLKLEGYDPEKLPDVVFAEEPQLHTDLAPHFSVFVRDYLYEKYGEDTVNRLGFRVTTTLDRDAQSVASTLIKQHIENLGRRDATNAGLVSLNPKTGEIISMVGSVDYSDEEFGKYNIAFARRQPGSTFKPIVYAQAFADGANPQDLIKDEPIDIGGYKPQNNDGKFRGEVTIRQALANSLNIPAVKILEKIGVSRAIKLAREMGISSLNENLDYGLSLVLGGGEVTLFDMTRAFGVFATNGKLVATHPILHIEDKFGNEIYRYTPLINKEIETFGSDSFFGSFSKPKEPLVNQLIGGTYSKQVLDSAAAFLVTNILSDNEARKETFGETNWLTIGRPAGAKTGTTNDFRDAWTIGFTPELVTGVWVGNNDNSPMSGLYGSVAAAPIWNGFMIKFLTGKSVTQFEKPSTLIEVEICKETNTRCSLCKETVKRYYSKKYLPPEDCSKVTPTTTPTPTSNPTNTPVPTKTPTPTTIIQQPTTTPTPTENLTPTTNSEQPTATPTEAISPSLALTPTI